MKTSKRVIFQRSLWVVQIMMVLPVVWFAWHLWFPRGFISRTAEVLPVVLSGGPFETLYYAADKPKGILIVATGDGGWSNQWEEPVALHASASGYAVGGWDCRKFADTRKFNHEQLVEAFNAATESVRNRAELPEDCPVWYAGWSTGADWSLSAAASPQRERNLVGVLAVAPGKRSRYGISGSDLLGIMPEGEDTFALLDLAPALRGIHVAQFAAMLDPLDDTSLIKSLGVDTPHKLVEIPDVPHDMGGAGERFLSEFYMAIQWMLDTPLTASGKTAGGIAEKKLEDARSQ